MEKYFVVSDGEQPARIEFDRAKALDPDVVWAGKYVDSFDEHGQPVKSYKLIKCFEGEKEWYKYTTDF